MKELKAFDKVLVRNSSDQVWRADIFSYYEDNSNLPYHCIDCCFYKYCIPYEGNEDLLGTTNKPNKDSSGERKPKFKSLYWHIDGILFSVKADIWLDGVEDIERYEVGNCFNTEEEAKAMADKIKKLLKNK